MAHTVRAKQLLAAISPKFGASLKPHLVVFAKTISTEILEKFLSDVLEQYPEANDEAIAFKYLESWLELNHEQLSAHPVGPNQPPSSSPRGPADSPGGPTNGYDHADAPNPLVPKPADFMPPAVFTPPPISDDYAIQQGGLPVPQHLHALRVTERDVVHTTTIESMRSAYDRDQHLAAASSQDSRKLITSLSQNVGGLSRARVERYMEARQSGDRQQMKEAQDVGDAVHAINGSEIKSFADLHSSMVKQTRAQSAWDNAKAKQLIEVTAAAERTKALQAIEDEQANIAAARAMVAEQAKLADQHLDEGIRRATLVQSLKHSNAMKAEELRTVKRRIEDEKRAAAEDLDAKKRKFGDLLATYLKYDEQFQKEWLEAVEFAHKNGKSNYNITYQPPKKIHEDGKLVRVEPGWVQTDLRK